MWHLRGQSVELLDVIGKIALVGKADLIRNLTDGQNAGVLSALPPFVRLGRPHNSISKPHGRYGVASVFCASEPNLAEFFVPEAGPTFKRAQNATQTMSLTCARSAPPRRRARRSQRKVPSCCRWSHEAEW